jgi:hypothetical protein
MALESTLSLHLFASIDAIQKLSVQLLTYFMMEFWLRPPRFTGPYQDGWKRRVFFIYIDFGSLIQGISAFQEQLDISWHRVAVSS